MDERNCAWMVHYCGERPTQNPSQTLGVVKTQWCGRCPCHLYGVGMSGTVVTNWPHFSMASRLCSR